MADLWRLSISEASESLARREISAVELTRAHLDRIEDVEGRVRAFVTVTDQDALRDAEEIDRRRAEGQALGPLAGVPLGDQGCALHERRAHHLLLAHPGAFCPAL